jgi:hypothetical protein
MPCQQHHSLHHREENVSNFPWNESGGRRLDKQHTNLQRRIEETTCLSPLTGHSLLLSSSSYSDLSDLRLDRVSLAITHQSSGYVNLLLSVTRLTLLVDSCIDALVIRGALQMSRFLSGDYVPAIAWLEQRQGEGDLIRPGHSVRRIVAPIAVTALIIFRQSYLPALLNLLETIFATESTISSSPVINFGDVDNEFQTNSVLYFFGMVYATVVSYMRKMHLLL